MVEHQPLRSVLPKKKQKKNSYNPSSNLFHTPLPSFSLINSPVLSSYSSAEEQGRYLSISSYWSPERAQSAGNQDPQTVLWRNRKELNNGISDEGNDPFKKQLDAKRWASQIATVPFVFPPPLISVQRQPGLNDKDTEGSSVADTEKCYSCCCFVQVLIS